MSSLVLLLAGLLTYFGIVQRTRDLFAPCALLCLFWFTAASLADIASLKDPLLQRAWELETYGAVYLSGFSVFTIGFIFARPQRFERLKANPSVTFRRVLNLLMLLSIMAVALRLYVFGFSIEQLILSFGTGDIKDELSEAIPGVHYFEILTPFLCLCALYELRNAGDLSPIRRRLLKAYGFYTVVIYCILLSASRGTLLVVLTGAMFLYARSSRLKASHLALLGGAVVALMSGLSFLRMSSETMTNSFLGDQVFQAMLSPIYTYVAFNFENLNTLVRADLPPTYVFYSLKSFLWPFFKADYQAELIRLTNFDTLFFNARTYLYPFYHDLGLIGCIIYPAIIALALVWIHNSTIRHNALIMVLMALQKPIWFAFFGNYFFGELVVFIPLVVVYMLSSMYEHKLVRRQAGQKY